MPGERRESCHAGMRPMKNPVKRAVNRAKARIRQSGRRSSRTGAGAPLARSVTRRWLVQ